LGSRMQIKIEDTMSRTGKHRRVSRVFVANKEGNITSPKVLSSWSCNGVYKKGRSICGYINVEEGYYLILVELTLNWRGNIKGYINVVNSSNSKVLAVKYVNGKLRYVSGNRVLFHLAKASLDKVVGEVQWKGKKS